MPLDEEMEAKKRALDAFDPSSVLPGLSEIESSGGKFREHDVNKSGLQKGTRAVSSYGLMPNTVYEYTKRDKEFQKTPQGQAILSSNGDPESINEITRDVNNDDVIMKSLLAEQNKRLNPHSSQYGVDAEVANVLANRRGVAGAIKSMRDGSYKEDPYVIKYLQLKNKTIPVI